MAKICEVCGQVASDESDAAVADEGTSEGLAMGFSGEDIYVCDRCQGDREPAGDGEQ